MKPVTDLVLLPALELIPIESLPQRHREELALLNKECAQAAGNAIGSFVPILLCGVLVVLFGWFSFLAMSGHESIFLIFLFIPCFAGSVVTNVFLWQESVREVRAYRQMAIPPQLKIDAEEEKLLSDTAQRVNTQIADWNTAAENVTNWNATAENAKQRDLGGRHLHSLEKHREALSVRIAQIKKLATRVGATK